MIKVDISQIKQLVSDEDIKSFQPRVKNAIEKLEKGTGEGHDFLGWLDLPSSIGSEFISDIGNAAEVLRDNCDVVVVAGIGGSYLGARAVIEAFSNNFSQLIRDNKNPTILFAGHNISEDYLSELTCYLKDKDFGIINISKSGTTTETALAFRLLKEQCETQRGKDIAKKVIVTITDASHGAARLCADREGYRSFIIPDNIGGRYSVLTPVGLLPIAVAGFDIEKLVAGAADMEKLTNGNVPLVNNPAAVYAVARNALYESGKKIEILVSYQPKLHYFAEWWKQLYGESEGKNGKGIYPSSVAFSTDLHSMGQWIQQGERIIFETVLSIDKVNSSLLVPFDSTDSDGLNYLTGKHIDEVNKMAELGTRLAHVDGGVPNIRITIPKLDEYWLGQLIYFFEKACGISGYLLNINPFDQPGVEKYKKNMFALLGKPGYEDATMNIYERLKK